MKVKIYPNQKSPRLFNNQVLEFLTKSHPAVIFGMYTLLSIFLMYFFITNLSGNLLQVFGWFGFGLVSWTLAEYLMHRFVYHKIKDASFNTGFQYMFHGIHHQYPNDDGRIVLPPLPSMIFAAIFFSLFYLIMGKYAFAFSPGFVIGYSIYTWIHHTIHNTPAPKKFNFWWTHHNIHHFQQHDKAFGITTPVWDILFRTMPKKNRRTVFAETKNK